MVARISCVVEGHGDVEAVPVLLRRMAHEIAAELAVEVLKPVRRPRSALLNKQGELERAVELCARKAAPCGCVMILIDADDDCPASLAPNLRKRAEAASLGLPLGVVLAKREFEAWFLAGARSLAGLRGLPTDLQGPENPEDVRGAKEWLQARMDGRAYSETIDQPALAALVDLAQARTAQSFEKCRREVALLLGQLEPCAGTGSLFPG